MNNIPATKSTRRWPIYLAIALMALVGLAYAWYVYRFPTWTEEVLLADGRKIVVKQKRDYIAGYGTRKTWLTFSLPEMGGEQTWSENLMPSIIAVDRGKVYVIGMPRGPKQYNMYNGPRWFLVAFVWAGSSFQRVPLAHIPYPIRQNENVFRCLPLKKNEHVTWSNKALRWCESATATGSFDPKLDYYNLELISQRYARMDGHTSFSE